MSNYFDNQTSWEWHVSDNNTEVFTDHGNHTHTLNLSGISISQLASDTGRIMGNAHRASTHDFKTNDNKEKTDMANRSEFLKQLKVDNHTLDKLNDVIRNYNSNAVQASKVKETSSGRERADDGPHKQGREADLKASSSPSKVTSMKADMAAHAAAHSTSAHNNGHASAHTVSAPSTGAHNGTTSGISVSSAPSPTSGGQAAGHTGGHSSSTGH